MRRRILLSTLLSLLLAGSIAALAAFRVAGAGSHLGREAACAAEHEGEADRGDEGRCESVADLGREIQEPADVMLARDLFGSDPNIDYEKAFSDAAADGDALARQTARVDAPAAQAAWKSMGPYDIGGRVLDIAVDPQQPDTIYIATATGGVWKSTDAGATFKPSWPDNQTLSIGALAITPSGTLYAGTGETGPGGGSITFGGNGLYRSTDHGASWQRIALPDSSRIARIVVDPRNEKRIFVAASGPLYRPGGERGL